MGYSKKESSIRKVERFLTLMVDTDDNLEWETTDPDKLAYYIREGIHTSGVLYRKEPANERLRNFSMLKSKFVIKIKGNHVIAALRSEIPLAVLSVKKMKSVYLPNIMSLTEIVGAVANYIIEENKEQIPMPNTSLNDREFEQLQAYLESKELEIEVNGDEFVINKSPN